MKNSQGLLLALFILSHRILPPFLLISICFDLTRNARRSLMTERQ